MYKNNNDSRGIIVLAFILLIITMFLLFGWACVRPAAAQEIQPSSYEYTIVGITSWVTDTPPDDPNYEPAAHVGIYIGSDECPEGAVLIDFEYGPANYGVDEITNVCPDGMQTIGGYRMADVLSDIMEIRIEHNVYVMEQSYFFTNMSQSQFWDEVFAAGQSARDYLENEFTPEPEPVIPWYIPFLRA